MPRPLPPIPSGIQIVNSDGSITIFFRGLWQQIVNSFLLTSDVAIPSGAGQNATIAPTTAFIPQVAGWYRVSYYLRKTINDGVSSSLTMTIGWTDHGQPLTQSGAALVTDTAQAQQNGSFLFYSDAVAPITYAIAYASNTPGAMKFNYGVVVEQMA